MTGCHVFSFPRSHLQEALCHFPLKIFSFHYFFVPCKGKLLHRRWDIGIFGMKNTSP